MDVVAQGISYLCAVQDANASPAGVKFGVDAHFPTVSRSSLLAVSRKLTIGLGPCKAALDTKSDIVMQSCDPQDRAVGGSFVIRHLPHERMLANIILAVNLAARPAEK